ncbi:MAG: ribosome silencing factor [Bacteroidetes bacterium]|nr:ribosome silencing factor [Bacteroidota bacterium]
MAKTPLKKSASKKTTRSSGSVSKKSSSAKAPAKKSAAKKTAKKPVSEKELLQREANKIVNSEKKKKSKPRPKKHATKEQTSSLLEAVIDGMQEKKGKNITVIDLQKLENRVCDFFVICDADSTTHVNAIADSVEEIAKKKTNESPYHTEGYQNSEWIIIDYINIVAHVFLKEKREFYNIEGLWADGEFKHYN